MLQNYLQVALRSLRKHFSYSLINIVGLGLGLATYLLLVVWVRNELSYDRFHEKADRIYRASLEFSFGGQTNKTSVSPTALLPALEKNFAEVQTGVRVYNPSSYNPYILRVDDKLFQEARFYFADSTFFDVFSFRLREGSPTQALTQPNSVVITRSMAKKYFGNADALGKVILVNNSTDYTVTGVMEDVPENSLLQFDFVASFSSLAASREQIWWSANYETFLLLAPGADVAGLQKKTNALVKKELAAELTSPGDYVVYNFMPLTDIYLRSDMEESEITGSINYVYGFGAIAALILIIASINYVNLATARAADRAREVSIRKVVGALRKQLFLQFIGESVILTGLAFILAFFLAQGGLSLFNSITGKHFAPTSLLHPSILFYSLLTLVFIAFVAGAYPAVAITSFRPVSVLKGNFKSSGKGIWLRKSLVVFQFCVSIVLIVGTTVVLKQLKFLQGRRLGYDKENVVLLPLDRKTSEVYGALRTEILKSGHAVQVGRATESPTNIHGGYTVNITGSTGERGMLVTAMSADTSFIPTLGMELVAGRNFNVADFKKLIADTTYAFVLNESALKELSLDPEKAIGRAVSLNGRRGEVVGVVKDFHFASLHSAIRPLVFFNENGQYNQIFVRLKTGSTNEGLGALKSIASQLMPHRPFEYEFLDQKYQALYSAEERMGTISTAFASLAIVIACLGLFGLVAFSAAQKTKEIGIRKVMGATVSHIVILITRDYTRLVIFSIVLGLPLAYWVVEHLFLSSFAYRTSLGAGPFAFAALGCLLIAFGTATYQALKAATLNPTESLRE